MKRTILFLALSLFAYSCKIKDDLDTQPQCVNTYMNWTTTNGKHFVMANIFTPNGDGKNDLLRVLGATANVSDFEMTVSNSNGTKLFQTSDIKTSWDGKDNQSTSQPQGIYSVKISMNVEGESKQFHQCVYLAKTNGNCVDTEPQEYHVFEDQFDQTTLKPIFVPGELYCP